MADQPPFRLPFGALPVSPPAINQPATPVGFSSSNLSNNIFGGSAFNKANEISSNATDTSNLSGGSLGFVGNNSLFGNHNPNSINASSLPKPNSSEVLMKSSAFISSSNKGEEISNVAPNSSIFGSSSQLSSGVKPSIFGGSSSKTAESFGASQPSVFGGISKSEEPATPARAILSNSIKPPDPFNVSHGAQFSSNNPFFSGAKPLFGQQSSTSSGSLSGSGSFKVTFGQISESPPQVTCSSTSLAKEEPSFQQKSLLFGGLNNTSPFRVPSATLAPSQSSASLSRRSVLLQSSSSVAGSSAAPDSSKMPVLNIDAKPRNAVSSSMPHIVLRDRSVESHIQNLEDEENNPQSRSEKWAEERDRDWEPDSMSEEDQEENHTRAREKGKIIRKSAKIVRRRGVFAKALDNVFKLSEREQNTEELKSVYCRPIDGKLPDKDVLKAHFSQFGAISRTNLNSINQYCIITYKTHEEAARAMKECSQIGELKVRMFWRETAKLKRRAEEDTEAKSTLKETIPKRSRRGNTELNPDVKKESDAMSRNEFESSPVKTAKSQVEILKRRVKKDALPNKMDIDSEVKEELAALSQLGYWSQESRPSSEGERTKTANKLLKSRLGRTSKERKSTEKSPEQSKIKKPKLKKVGKASNVESKAEKVDKETPESSAGTPSIGSTAGASDLMAIMRTPALTSEDKLQVLEARDKLIRLRLVKQYDLSKAKRTVGTCPDMCPEKERLLRESRRQVSQYEMSSSKMNHSLMVKQYSRSSADQEEPLPHELRPPHILTMTMNYLLHNIVDLCDKPGENLAEWYHFLWDRTRGIRKEITQQELCDVDAVSLVEQCARFHIHCCARLVAEDVSVFDDRINTENLTKCLQTLKHMYHDLWIKSSVTCPNEPEFITYFILLNLNNGTIMWEMEQLREEVLTSPEVVFAASLYSSLSSNNFVRFFRLVRNASYLNSCLCIRYFYQIRSRALRTYVKALAKVRPVQYPLSSLVRNLGFESLERAASFCVHHGLQVDEGSSEATSVLLSSEAFYIPDTVLPRERAFQLAEVKRKGLVGEVVYGGTLPPRSFEQHVPHNSFDSKGLLRLSAHTAKDQGVMSGDKEVDLFTEETEHIVNNEAPSTESSVDVKIGSLRESLLVSKVSSKSEPGSQKLVSEPFRMETQASTKTPIALPSFVASVAPSVPAPPVQRAPKQQETTMFNRTIGSPFVPHNHQIEKSSRTFQAEPLKVAMEEEARAVKALEESINIACSQHEKRILDEVLCEEIEKIANSAVEDIKGEEKEAKEQELRQRILDAHIERVSSETVTELLESLLPQMVSDLASEAVQEERFFEERITFEADNFVQMCISAILEEECRAAALHAREEAIQCVVRDCFYHWLLCARRSLRMKYAMEDFPAGVLPLSIKEHAQRWGLPDESQLSVWKGRYGRHEKALDLPELKTTPPYIQTTLADLIGLQALHRYDLIRTKIGLHRTDHLLYKLLISLPDHADDPGSHIIEWWIRRAFKQSNCMLFDNDKIGVLRLMSGLKVTSTIAVYASLQMVKGSDALKKQPSLVSGTSAVLFTVSPCSSIPDSQFRLRLLLQATQNLPPIPLVVVVVSPSEPPLAGLKQLVVELELDNLLSQNVICDYQILHVEERADVEKLTDRIKPALNYMTMTWTPTPQVDIVLFRSIFMSTFQMFYISIQFNYNSSEIYPQDVDDPRLLIGLCNDWLDLMCEEFSLALQEAKDIYGDEFWPLLHKGAFLPFVKNPLYEQYLRKIIMSIKLPEIKEWPPCSETALQKWFHEYTSWLRPDDLKTTLKRLSCLSHLPFSEKLKKIPWIHLVEGWMEARMLYANTTDLNGTEMLCAVRSANVEQLYADAWWAHSKHISAYLKSSKAGKEIEMDLDDTVPFSNSMHQTMEESTTDISELRNSTTVNELQDVTNCVSALKDINDSVMSRLKQALVTGSEYSSGKDVSLTASETGSKSEDKTPSNVDSLMKSIDAQIQIHHNVNSNINMLLSSALLSEAHNKDFHEVDLESVIPTIDKESHQEPEVPVDPCVQEEVLSKSMPDKEDPSKKMADIMESMKHIMSSLEKNHKMLAYKQDNRRILGLKIGSEKADVRVTPYAPEILHRSAFVVESEKHLKERILRNHFRGSENEVMKKQQKFDSADSDLEVLSDNEGSISSYSKSASSLSSRYSAPDEDFEPSSPSIADEPEEAQLISSDDSVSSHESRVYQNTKRANHNSSHHLKELTSVWKDISIPVSHQHHPERMVTEVEELEYEECGEEDNVEEEEEMEEVDFEMEEEGLEVEEECLEVEEEEQEHEEHSDAEEDDSSSVVREDSFLLVSSDKKHLELKDGLQNDTEDELEHLSAEDDFEDISSDGDNEPLVRSSELSDIGSVQAEAVVSRSESAIGSSGFTKEDGEERSSPADVLDDSVQEASSDSESESYSDIQDTYSNDNDSSSQKHFDGLHEEEEAEDSEPEAGSDSLSDDCEVID